MPGSTIAILVFAVFVALLAYLAAPRSRKLAQISLKDWILYVAIGLIIIASAVLLSITGSVKAAEPILDKAFAATAPAAIVFGTAAHSFWRYRKRRTFWISWGALLIAHFAILIPFLYGTNVPVMLILLVALPEAGLVHGFLAVVLRNVDYDKTPHTRSVAKVDERR